MFNPAEFEITDGYVGSFGITWKTATDATMHEAVQEAEKRNNQSSDVIFQRLINGEKIAWCDSPNHYYDRGTGYIRRKRNAPRITLVECDCGHSVPSIQVMRASLGTSCPDCYDRMSN